MEKPDFESIKRFNVLGHEYWSARDLMPLLGYGKKWQNFEKVIRKATISAQKAELHLEGHFTGVSKMSLIGQGGQRPTQDYFLSRHACYLIAQNGDPRKPEIAAAQQYFAVSTVVLNDLTKLRVEQEQRLALRMCIYLGGPVLFLYILHNARILSPMPQVAYASDAMLCTDLSA